MRSIAENMRGIMDRLQELTESLLGVPEAMYEAVDNLEVDSRGELVEGDYVLCWETLKDDMSDTLTEWREHHSDKSLIDSGDRWAIFKKN
jgi:hypothetical protein